MENSKGGKDTDGTSQSKQRQKRMKRETGNGQEEASGQQRVLRKNDTMPSRRVGSTRKAENIQQTPTCYHLSS